MKIHHPVFCFALLFCFVNANTQVTHITNSGIPPTDGILNLLKSDESTSSAIDILALDRATSSTAQNGIGGSLLFRNELDNGGYGIGGRISSIATNVQIGNNVHAMRFDVYSNGNISRSMYLNSTGLGIGTLVPAAMLDVSSQSTTPAHFRGIHPLWMGIYESGSLRGYVGSYTGAAADVDFGTSSGNTTGKVHLVTQGEPKFTLDAAGNVGIGTLSPATFVDVQGASVAQHLLKATVNWSGSSDLRAVEGYSVPNPGYGIGGYFTGGWRGCNVTGNGGTYGGTTYGLYTQATGTAGTRIALFSAATGGTTNWAGYFTSGNVYIMNDLRIGNTDGATGYKLSVDGKIAAEEVRVQNSIAWPDYVFETDYPLIPLEELQQQIRHDRHLPGIPPASVIEAEGFDLAKMQATAIQKIEELTLYVLELHAEITSLKAEQVRLESLLNH